MSIIQAKKQRNKQTNKGQMMKQKNFLHRPSSKKREKFDEVICCVIKFIENIEMFTKDFL